MRSIANPPPEIQKQSDSPQRLLFKPSRLVLDNGLSFEGFCPDGQEGIYAGEVVFTTGMTGYEGSLTDPSFTEQILVFTYPLMGNYGVPPSNTWESHRGQVKGVVVSEACMHPSLAQGRPSLLAWLKEQEIPILIGVDTRALTKLLRTRGSTLGAIVSGDALAPTQFPDPNTTHLVQRVCALHKSSYETLHETKRATKTIGIVDCGMKENILRLLRRFPLNIHRLPYNYDYTKENYDGIFLSNGPGDPMMCQETIAILKKAFAQKIPIFGICLGHQLMGLAARATTYKLLFGHRGQNQPCVERKTGRCFITSQNHGFAIDEASVPNDWEVTYHNLNDLSVEGIAHKTLPFRAVQFHPEGAPGPTDCEWMFNSFYEMMG